MAIIVAIHLPYLKCHLVNPEHWDKAWLGNNPFEQDRNFATGFARKVETAAMERVVGWDSSFMGKRREAWVSRVMHARVVALHEGEYEKEATEKGTWEFEASRS